MRLRRILTIVRLGVSAHRSLERAARVAAASNTELHLAAVVYEPNAAEGLFSWHRGDREAERSALKAEARAELRRLAAEVRMPNARLHVVWGHPLDRMVLELQQKLAADLVFIQPRDPYGTRLSTAEWRLLRACPVPVWLARAGTWTPRAPVVAAVDPQPKREWADRAVLSCSHRIASELGTPHIVLHGCGEVPELIGIAQDPKEYEQEFEALRVAEIRRLLPSEGGCEPEIRVLPTGALEAILRCCAEGPRCVLVLGVLARRTIEDRLIGSTARRVVPHTLCDVLFVPGAPD